MVIMMLKDKQQVMNVIDCQRMRLGKLKAVIDDIQTKLLECYQALQRMKE